ncbi:MAG: hypothetical protein NZ749_09645, partial [bacterium]|nr:hypothetical protein [bacterium]
KSLPTSGLLQASRDGRWLLVYEKSLLEETAELWQLQPPQQRLRLTLPRYSQVVLSADGRFLF